MNSDMRALLSDCDVEFFRAGGPGGQHRNKVETGVRLHHRPTGFKVQATERRSQSQNKSLALKRLAQGPGFARQLADVFDLYQPPLSELGHRPREVVAPKLPQLVDVP